MLNVPAEIFAQQQLRFLKRIIYNPGNRTDIQKIILRIDIHLENSFSTYNSIYLYAISKTSSDSVGYCFFNSARDTRRKPL